MVVFVYKWQRFEVPRNAVEVGLDTDLEMSSFGAFYNVLWSSWNMILH